MCVVTFIHTFFSTELNTEFFISFINALLIGLGKTVRNNYLTANFHTTFQAMVSFFID
jgi:hypothetical protein